MKILFAAPMSSVRISIFISSYYHSLAKAAMESGVSVEMHDTKELIASSNIPQIARILYKPLASTIERFQLLSFTEADMRNQLFRHVKHFLPDIVFLHSIQAQTMHQTVKDIRKLGPKVVMWMGLNPKAASAGARKVLKEVDCIFCYDESYFQEYKELGCQKVEIVPLGIDSNHCDSIAPASQPGKLERITFIGIIDSKRYELLSEIRDLNPGFWSWNYSAKEYPLIARQYRGETSGESTISILKSSLISINAHREFERSGGNYRLFEIPACGALQMVDNMPAISRYFNVGEEIIVYKNAADLKSKALYFLDHEDERNDIISRALKRVRTEHTVKKRFELMLEITKTL